MIDYFKLDKHFTSPQRLSPFYTYKRIPRKLKKKVKAYCGIHYHSHTINQNLWHYLEKKNKDYKRFLIKKICDNYEIYGK